MLLKERHTFLSIRQISTYLKYFEDCPPDQFLTYLMLWCRDIGALQTKHYYSTLQKPIPQDEYLTASNFKTENRISVPDAGIINRPKFTIITRILGLNSTIIKRTFESVKCQSYTEWEYHILYDQEAEFQVDGFVSSIFEEDFKVKMTKMVDLQDNLAAGFNKVIDDAEGEFFGFLGTGDELTDDALYEFAAFINRYPSAKIIYSDEAKKGDNFFLDINYKPGWSPDLMYSTNYIGNFLCCKKEMAYLIGGLAGVFEQHMKYDLVLKCMEKTDQIFHLPKILYHQHVPQSRYPKDYKADYAHKLERMALDEHIKRIGINAEVINGLFDGSFRVRRKILKDSKVSIIIPTKDRIDYLQRCIESITTKTTYQNYEIIIVDNGSSQPELLDYLNDCPHVVLPFPGEFNFSSINNYAAAQASGEYLVFLNNDTEVISPEWLEAMLEHAQRKEVGVVGAKLLYPDGLVQHAGIRLVRNRFPDHVHRFTHSFDHGSQGMVDVIRNYNAVTAACMMLRSDVFKEVEGFNSNLRVVFNDVDLCFKVRARGYSIVYTPYAALYHYEGVSRWSDLKLNEKELNIFLSRWGL
jgi:GT2 family glycosyltransferase